MTEKMVRIKPTSEKPSFSRRLWRSVKVEASLFDEVKADSNATGQAMAIVVLATLASSLGQGDKFATILIQILLGIGLWYLGARVVYFLGSKVFPEAETRGEVAGVLRAVGFSNAPGLILIFSVFPDIAVLISLVGFIWVMVADVIAIRQSLNFNSIFRPFGIWIISMFVRIIVYILFAHWFGVLPAT